MENIEINGDFITIRETTFNLNELISFKPEFAARIFFPHNGGTPKEIARGFPKIIVDTKSGPLEFVYNTKENRDEALIALTEKIKVYQATKSTKSENPNSISINVVGSSNVNIVNQSSGVTITQEQIQDAKNIINQIKTELDKIKETQSEEVNELTEALLDIEAKIEKKERIPRLSFKSFLETSANLADIGSLAISLGQIIGMIPTH